MPWSLPMSKPDTLAKRFLRDEWTNITDEERRVVEAIVLRSTLSRDARKQARDERTFGERLADRVASFGGSWTFILIFFAILLLWAVINSELLGPADRAFDPYPFIFLNLLLSMLAALQAPVIMMSQNRQAALDRAHAEADYGVNLKAEIEIQQLHEKLDELREARWAALVKLQERQIAMLTELLEARARASTGAVKAP